jgi:hypothetical protein
LCYVSITVVSPQQVSIRWLISDVGGAGFAQRFVHLPRIGAGNFHGIREMLPLLNPFKGFVGFGLWSHKIIRWIVPFLLILIFSRNLWLVGKPLYNVLFALQAFFYSLALLAWILDRFNLHVSFLIYPYYFVVVNLALLVGFFKFITKSQKPAWARVERQRLWYRIYS